MSRSLLIESILLPAWLLVCSGCQAGPISQSEWDRRFEAEQARIVLPVDPRHLRLELTPEWLEGYWVSGKAACYGSDSGISFTADGTYSEHEQGGRYRIDGSRVELTVTEIYDSPEPLGDTVLSFTARLAGPNEIDTSWSDGESTRLYRCPPEPLSD